MCILLRVSAIDKLEIILQREDRVPMPQGQMDALRMEVEDQQWLDALMALMKAAGNDTRMRILYLSAARTS